MGRRKIYKEPPSLNVEAPQPSVYQPNTVFAVSALETN
jgi:hypothetical protein